VSKQFYLPSVFFVLNSVSSRIPQGHCLVCLNIIGLNMFFKNMFLKNNYRGAGGNLRLFFTTTSIQLSGFDF